MTPQSQNQQPLRAVVLLQLGGPDSPDAVRPFLYDLFCDPDIIDLPGAFLFRRPLATLISRLRAPKVQELYNAIGGSSPILDQTRQQADSLSEYFAAHGEKMHVEIAMRYWNPSTEDAHSNLVSRGIKEVVLLPLYPQYSKATTGSSIRKWQKVNSNNGNLALRTMVVEQYHDHPIYIKALVERINEAIQRVPADERSRVHLVFSAHGTPMQLVRRGDPYSHQIRRTYELVLEQGKLGLPHHLCFQSKVGPQRWLEPSLVSTIDRLGELNVTHIIVNPIAFVSDHLETLSEIGLEARHQALSRGVKYFDVTAPLLTSGSFIECLGRLVLDRIHS